uniref:Secreted protein n=1 Tax=Ficedula albicollis TaxID=59894 RepID=A0A803VL54_FICAL
HPVHSNRIVALFFPLFFLPSAKFSCLWKGCQTTTWSTFQGQMASSVLSDTGVAASFISAKMRTDSKMCSCLIKFPHIHPCMLQYKKKYVGFFLLLLPS